MIDIACILEKLESEIISLPDYAIYLVDVVLSDIPGVDASIVKACCDENIQIENDWLIPLGPRGTLKISVAKDVSDDFQLVFRLIGLEVAYRRDLLSKQMLSQRLSEIEKLNYDKIVQTQALLVRQEKLASIGQLASGIAHELNNPLGYIAGNFEVLKSYHKSMKEYVSELEEIVRESNPKKLSDMRSRYKIDFMISDISDIFSESSEGFKRVNIIVDNLLSFARLDTDKIKSGNLNNSVAATTAMAKSEFKFVAEVITEMDDINDFEFNHGEINQVLLNLILNSTQAIKSQNRMDMGHIWIKTWEDEVYVYCSVTDDGPGISRENIDKIFDPFFTTKPVGEGTGLGLSISHDIVVNKHNGELNIKSGNGRTEVLIKLPKYRG